MLKWLLAFVFLFSVPGFAQRVEKEFSARAFEAVDKTEKLMTKNGDSRGKNLTPQERCDWQLENIYMAFAHPELSKIAIVPAYPELLGKDGRAYRFVLLDNEGELGFQMNYVYAGKDDEGPIATEIYKIKEDWIVKFLDAYPNHCQITRVHILV